MTNPSQTASPTRRSETSETACSKSPAPRRTSSCRPRTYSRPHQIDNTMKGNFTAENIAWSRPRGTVRVYLINLSAHSDCGLIIFFCLPQVSGEEPKTNMHRQPKAKKKNNTSCASPPKSLATTSESTRFPTNQSSNRLTDSSSASNPQLKSLSKQSTPTKKSKKKQSASTSRSPDSPRSLASSSRSAHRSQSSSASKKRPSPPTTPTTARQT